ncbi:uncharacterized protein LOC132563085 [Ylistrum balloti]|uniref:uncharacterized protein LOC132563085 n=1 Tax=Ylistrum balloti TaxID=509963 RepID=UPI002905A871|nr:uncharacterized protein LOC132563085 [Ylistrum balloti]
MGSSLNKNSPQKLASRKKKPRVQQVSSPQVGRGDNLSTWKTTTWMPDGIHEGTTDMFLFKKQCRFPACTIKAQKLGISEWHWRSVIPVCIKEAESVYDITDWLGLHSHSQMSSAEHVPDQIKQTITSMMKPLESLYFEKKTSSWNYKTDFTDVLSIDQQTITQGFISDMSNSRGRSMIHGLLAQLFSSDTSVKAVNIGGTATVNEPSVRELAFEVTFEDSDSDSSPMQSPAKQSESAATRHSPRNYKAPLKDIDCITNQVFKFVPDIVLESTSREHLLIEIKKGRLLYPQSISQLRYMLMPAAIKQGSAVGVLICTNQALLERCIVAEDKVRFERKYFELREHSLVADMEMLFSSIYNEVLTTV